MTPKQMRIWSLLQPRKKYLAIDIAEALGIGSDLASSHLNRLVKLGFVLRENNPGHSRAKLYRRSSKQLKGQHCRSGVEDRGGVWDRLWPAADPVLTQAMRAICEVRT
jgi:predicted ArsR family transcriptional regulator